MAQEKARLVVDNLARGLTREQIVSFLGIIVEEVGAIQSVSAMPAQNFRLWYQLKPLE